MGGGIEFGESAADAAIREFKEEMNTDIEVGSYLHTFENIFIFNGKPGHEIVILLSATFKDRSIYEMDDVGCCEEGADFVAKWVHKSTFINGTNILYPNGLCDYLRSLG